MELHGKITANWTSQVNFLRIGDKFLLLLNGVILKMYLLQLLLIHCTIFVLINGGKLQIYVPSLSLLIFLRSVLKVQ